MEAEQTELLCKQDASSAKETSGSALLKLAAVVIIIAGLIAAKAIMIPILLAVFITILTSPLLIWLQEKGLNSAFALLGVVGILIIAMTLLGFLVSSSLNDFYSNLPLYEAKSQDALMKLMELMQEKGFEFSAESIAGAVDPGKITQFVSGIVKGFGAALANGFMILLLVVFMLLEASIFPKKLHAIHAEASFHMAEFLQNVKQYMICLLYTSPSPRDG